MPPAANKQQPALARLNTGNMLKIETVPDLMALADLLFKGGADQIPNVGRPERVARIILAGMEVGLSPAQSLESIMISKTGKCSIWGDAALALVRASGLMTAFREWVEGEGQERTGHAEAKRGEEVMKRSFSIRDANVAGLIERARGQKGDGPWITYPDRMLTFRARGFLLRDLFPDVMRGLVTTEEANDYPQEPIAVTLVSATANAPLSLGSGTAHTNAGVGLATVGPIAASDIVAPPVVFERKNDGPGAVTEDQLKQIVSIRASYFAGKGLQSETDQQSAWSELLAPYRVQSAREFTAEQAGQFIATEGPKFDPFNFPSGTPNSSKT